MDTEKDGYTFTSSNVVIRIGNLLDAREQYIAHQCNCVTVSAKGIAKHIFDRFPWSDCYAHRSFNMPETLIAHPGEIDVRGDGDTKRDVIGMMGQKYPGKPGQGGRTDTPSTRLRHFGSALYRIHEIDGLESIAFPYMIGCGLAGGDWKKYAREIDEFAQAHPHIQVALYKLK